MKIPNKKIFAYLKKYNKLDFNDIRDNRSFDKFKVDDITRLVLHLVESMGRNIQSNGFIFCHFTKKVKDDNNIYYGVLHGDLIQNPKLFYTKFKSYINENGDTYLLSENRFVVEFKKKIFKNDT